MTRKKTGFDDQLEVKGAEEHNLKHINLTIPKQKLVVFTGVSGSGKSSMAFDTIFAEGQRRYVESLSSYARQFLGQMDKPKYETIRGLSPTISIEQKAASKNPRSTVGTITEVYDYLRVLYARIGIQHCHKCGEEVGRGDPESMANQILELEPKTKVLLLAPIIENRKGEHKDLLEELKKEGYLRVRVNGVVSNIDDVQALTKHKKHTIEVVVDRLAIKKRAPEFRTRLRDSVETTVKLGKGQLVVHVVDGKDMRMSEARSCCGFAFPELDPPLFSFNSPQGMCTDCNGLGTVMAMDPDKFIPDQNLSIREGAVVPWQNYFTNGGEDKGGSWSKERFLAMETQWGIDFDTPWKSLPKKQKDLILHGGDKTLTISWEGEKSAGTWTHEYEGLLHSYMRRYLKTKSDSMKTWYQKYMSSSPCSSCQGMRLKDEVLTVFVAEKSIMDICALSIEDALKFFKSLKLTGNQQLIAKELIKEIINRLEFLVNVGLGYLNMNRHGPTLSGGEAQRIRLASQIGCELTGVLYILDEPSIGLHQRDNRKLLHTLCKLRDLGNSLIVVEHDQETIEEADYVVDFGPGAGVEGGQITAHGTPAQIKRARTSVTGKYLSGKLNIEVPEERRHVTPSSPRIRIIGAKENNLRNITVDIPLGVMTAVTGVSGAGKSTLINQILYPAIAKKLHHSERAVGSHDKIEGIQHIDKIINIDQKPIGRTPRSNPATYTKVFDLIRDFYALLPESKLRGYKKGRFSFNVKGGRCENCQGDGSIKVEMHFLADVFVPCEVCQGRRFNDSTCEILYKGRSIADVLDLSVAEACDVFANHPKILEVLTTLMDVGLSYIKLGQSATTLSGGEAQRIKLARELAKRDTGRTLYILDEPTTGLHFHDIAQLLRVLQRLADNGNTIVIIEHNLDVIKCADWIVDIGPEGGHRGGKLVAQGTPEKVARLKRSVTGEYLKDYL
ncbi:excinuclease ABC subunit UvrA [Pseudobacteriovorax antillogorgiicola]|uniref:UvrABC system protein A n=1 Tax=Pseudobacteriovorax antillogorgiicola TaxID=1513793 RepID=A0A1Y6C1E5_9BACT|nr:excinuclease ABC subunit UvrA [Pseudobacteriovorax antillogorgiicola]TCS50698.1 excinuclease ABC subunit A [Pseudobacteriovorax antillogorgiicola]SMF40483.1 Excinuclease ABC subunit A [Pseudobacteriovorax antillogorgiicola]